MIIMIFSKLMSKRKVTNLNAVIISVLLQMHTNEDNQHFHIFGCGHTHTCGVALHLFPSPLQFSAVITDLQLTLIEVHVFLKLVGMSLTSSVFIIQIHFEAAKTMLKLK